MGEGERVSFLPKSCLARVVLCMHKHASVCMHTHAQVWTIILRQQACFSSTLVCLGSTRRY